MHGDGLTGDISNNIYVPHAQDSWSSMVIVARTQSDPVALLSSMRRQKRTREIGIRMTLGAHRATVLGMVAGRALWIAATGVLCGVAGALALTRLMKTLLFGVTCSWPLRSSPRMCRHGAPVASTRPSRCATSERSSLGPQRVHRIQPRRSPRRHISRRQRHRHQHQRYDHESRGIARSNAEQ